HGDVAVLGGDVVDDPLADQDPPFADLLEAGEHPERGRLAAARRPDQDHELLVLDLDVEVLDDGDVGRVALDYVVISYGCHLFIPSPSRRSCQLRPCPTPNSIYLLLICKSGLSACEVEPRTTRLVPSGDGESTLLPPMRSINMRAASLPFSTIG